MVNNKMNKDKNFEKIVKDKLESGMSIKNYKAMCEILEQEEKKLGNSRYGQLKDWERYFNWEKTGHKFYIKEVYDVPKEKVDNRGKNKNSRNNRTKYLNNIENLVLNLLAQGSYLGYGKVFLSKSKMLKELEMINENYMFCKMRMPKLSEFMDIDINVVKDWFDSTSKMLEGNLDSALNRLKSQCLVLWSKEITIAKVITDNGKILKDKIVDEYDEEIISYSYHADKNVALQYREGTEDEKRFILHTERVILEEMNFKNKGEIIVCGRWDEFIERVNNVLLDKMDIAFYYKSYKILFNRDHILEKAIEIEDFKLSEFEEVVQKDNLNKGVLSRTSGNAFNRHKRAKEEKDKIIGESHNNVIEFRSKDNYMDNTKKLNDNLIKPSAKDIRNSVKQTKFNKTK